MNKQLSKNYTIVNKVLNILIRRKFGKHYFIRLNSLHFVSNRTDVFYLHTCSEKITLKAIEPVSITELISIREFILLKINSALLCIDYKSYVEVTDVEIIIM
jgi:hypothetical protein